MPSLGEAEGRHVPVRVDKSSGWHALRNEGRGKAANHALRCAPTTCHPPDWHIVQDNMLKHNLHQCLSR